MDKALKATRFLLAARLDLVVLDAAYRTAQRLRRRF